MYSIKNESRLEIQVQKLYCPLFGNKKIIESQSKRCPVLAILLGLIWAMRPRFRPLGNTAESCCMQDDLDPPDPSPKSAPSSH
jgi:hypothetical protein